MSNNERDLEESVLDGMARTLWVHAYIAWATLTGQQTIGESWEEMTPETPPAARLAADDIAKSIGYLNGFTRYPMVALFRAVSPPRSSGDPADAAYRFGQGVAMATLGASPNSPSPTIRIPMLRVSLEREGTELAWQDNQVWSRHERV